MKFSERWRLVSTIATEASFQGYLEMNPTSIARVKENPERISRRLRRSGKIRAFMMGFIIIFLAVITMVVMGFNDSMANPTSRMAFGVSVFLGMSFVVVLFANLTPATGFFTSGVMDLPATLPISRRELENLSVLVFMRVFIVPAVLILTVLPVLSFVVFGVLTALAVLVACAATVIFSIGALVHIAKWFYIKSHSADDSRLSGVVRVLASLGLAVGMIVVISIGGFLPQILEFITSASASIAPETFAFLALLYPFSFGFMASAATYGGFLQLDTVIAAAGASAIYLLLAFVSYRRTGQSLRSVAREGISTARIIAIREAAVSITGPLKSMIRKDLKLASRNIGSAMVFAIPMFLVIMMFPMIHGWALNEGSVRSMAVLVAVEYGNVFAGMAVISLMLFDTQGASIHAGLPLRSMLTLETKAAIAMVPYICSMVILAIICVLYPLISPIILLIPFIQIPCGYAIALAVGGGIYRSRGQGRAVAVNIMFEPGMAIFAAGVAAVVGIVPLVGYGITMLVTGNHIASIIVQLMVVIPELFLVRRQVPKLLRN
ncbi:MAG: hypothetical protein RTU09_01140 [Candidatus Thorarchaeota archaeon]